MLLSVIVVSYNTQDITGKCLDLLFKFIRQSKFLCDQSEIIVIDNNSKDNSPQVIKDIFHKYQATNINTKLIDNNENQGFAKANNRGIQISQGKYILLLNSDVYLQAGTLDHLIGIFENYHQESTAQLTDTQKLIDNVGVVSAQLLNSDGSIQPTGGDLPTIFSLFNTLFFIDDLPLLGKFLPSIQHTGITSRRSKTRLIKKGWVGATCMMVKKQVFDEVGLLDENIFMYAEDVEFCQRVKNHHYDIVIDQDAPVIHLGSASSNHLGAIEGEIVGLDYYVSKHFIGWRQLVSKQIIKSGAYLRAFVFGTILGKKELENTYRRALVKIS